MTTVVVGVHHRGEYRQQRVRLRDTIEENGFAVQEVPASWPCDDFSFSQGRYITRGEFKIAAVGGTLQFSDDFVIAATTSFTEKGEKLLKEAYNVPIHRFPTGNIGRKQMTHIDLYTLLAPKAKLLVVDGNFFDDKRLAFKAADEIADAHGLSVEEFVGPKEESFKYFPLNARVVTNSHEKAFVGFHSRVLEKSLAKHGVEMIAVTFDKTTATGGSVRCATNVCDGQNVRQYLDWPPSSYD